MSKTKDMTLTSVKVKSDLFENFKIECVKRKFIHSVPPCFNDHDLLITKYKCLIRL